MRALLPILAASGLIGFPKGTVLKAQEYEVSGTLHLKHVFDGRLFGEKLKDFTVCVKDGRWYIKEVPIKSFLRGKEQTETEFEDYSVCSTDLTNFYSLLSFERIKRSHPESENSAFGIIGPGAVPFGLEYTTLVLWYAFASEFYLKLVRDGLLCPPTQLPGSKFYDGDFRVAAQWQLFETAPFLPRRIAFNRAAYLPLVLDGPARPDLSYLTDCVYAVESVTNVSSMLLPARAVLRCYDFFETSNQIETVDGAFVEIQTTNVSPRVSISSFEIKPAAVTAFSDLRAARAGLEGAVASTGSGWPKLNLAASASLGIYLPGTRPAAGVRTGVWRPAWIFGGLLVVLATAILGIRWRTPSRDENN